MSMYSSGKQVLSNYVDDIYDFLRNGYNKIEDVKDYLYDSYKNGTDHINDRIYNGVMKAGKKAGKIKKDAEEKLAEFKNDVKDGKYIFGDGEGLFHNIGELYGKVNGKVRDGVVSVGKKYVEGVSEFGNGFFGTDLGQDISAVAKDVYDTGKELLSGVTPSGSAGGAGAAGSAGSAGGAGAAGSAGSPGTAQAISSGNFAPGATLFGMDRETAYQEYMANTAHQREVADLRAAGLNPVLGVSGSGASVVSGNAAGASSAQKGLDSGALVDVIGATAGLLTTIFTKNPSYGYMVKNAVSAGGDFVNSVKK